MVVVAVVASSGGRVGVTGFELETGVVAGYNVCDGG